MSLFPRLLLGLALWVGCVSFLIPSSAQAFTSSSPSVDEYVKNLEAVRYQEYNFIGEIGDSNTPPDPANQKLLRFATIKKAKLYKNGVVELTVDYVSLDTDPDKGCYINQTKILRNIRLNKGWSLRVGNETIHTLSRLRSYIAKNPDMLYTLIFALGSNPSNERKKGIDTVISQGFENHMSWCQ